MIVSKLKYFVSKVTVWRQRRLSERQFVLLLSLLVGILGGLAAFVLKSSIHYVEGALTGWFNMTEGNALYLAYPLLGILITVLFIRYFVKEDIGHGVSRILFAISKRNGRIKRHNTYSSIVASSLTIGLGGSVGAEAPIVLTGSAIGSNVSRLFKLDYKKTILLIGCGAAGAIAGIFKAPIAGIIFTLEVLMLDLTMMSMIPLLISAAAGASVAYFLMGDAVVFSFSVFEPFVLRNIPFYVLLGIICGFVSVYFTRGSGYIEKQFTRISSPFLKVAIGGISLGVLIFFFPSLYGEGYGTLKAILSGDGASLPNNSFFYGIQENFWFFILLLIAILGVKVIAMAITTGAGGVGGVFAPSLFMGGITGYTLALIINRLGFIHISENNFSLVGMAGVMAGVMHAPLTAIFLIAEITGGYTLFVPLIIASTISFLTINYFEKHSLYHKQLASRGELITHNKDRTVLTLMRLGNVVETDLMKVLPGSKLRDLVRIVSVSKRNIFPVVDEKDNLHGIILLDDIREIMFNHEMYDTVTVNELMVAPPDFISTNEYMDSVMQKFEETKAWNLPVIDDGKYIGFVSKSKIFNAYRQILCYMSEE